MIDKANRLDQGIFWVSGTGRSHRIDRMPPTHAQNAATWLQTHAVSVLMKRELTRPDGVTSQRIAEILADPQAQITDTVLYRALQARAAVTQNAGAQA